MKNAIWTSRKSEISAACSDSTQTVTAISAMTMKPRTVGFMSLQNRLTSASGGQRPHGERAGDQRSPREPDQAAPRLLRRVEPRREHSHEGQRPVRVVQPFGGPPSVREREQAEGDLRDDQRLDGG